MKIRVYGTGAGTNVANNPGALYFVFGLFALFGLVFAGIGAGTWMKAESTRRWGPVDGKVVASTVDRHHSSKSGTTYSAAVDYDYEYEGKVYHGSKIAIMSSSSSDRGAAQRTADRYAAGATVTVYVNPADAYEAVLQPGGEGVALVFVLFGGVFAAIGVAGLVNAPNIIARARADAQGSGEANNGPAAGENVSGGQDDALGRL